MAQCIEKLPHPECGSSDALQTFYNEEHDNYSGFCFACHTYVKDPYGGKTPEVKPKKTPAEIKAELNEIRQLRNLDTEYRNIPGEYWSKFGVKLGLSERDGKTPWSYYLPYSKTTDGKAVLAGYGGKGYTAKFNWFVGYCKGADPFNLVHALKVNAKRVYITEGGEDAIALYYALKESDKGTKYEYQDYSVVSLPSGSNSIASTLKAVSSFKEIVVVLDNDEAGQLAVKEAQRLNPDVMMVDIPMGCKDANHCLDKGLMKELANVCKWSAHKPTIEGVVQVAEIMERVIDKPTMGLSYPMENLTDMSFGQRFSECVCIGAGVSVGKTLLAHEWAAWNIIEHQIPCFMVMLEEENHNTVRNVAGKIDSVPYHRPDVEYDVEMFRETAIGLNKKLILWNSDGNQNARFDLEEIITAIRFNVAEFGTRFIYLDNMTRLVDHLNASDANEFINKYASELEALSTELDIHIDVFSHLNTPKSGPAHESGGRTQLFQFTGSRGIMRAFPMMMGFERNKMSPEHKHKSCISILKSRKYGHEGLIKTQYDHDTGRLIEQEWMNEDFLESYRTN